MDVMMPKMDGIEACEHLRKDKRFLNTIIMFLSARGEDFLMLLLLKQVLMIMSQNPLSQKY